MMRKLLLCCLAVNSAFVTTLSASAQQGDAANGQKVYQHWCSPCHAPGGRKHPGTSALQILYNGEKPAVLEERLDLTPELVTFYVRNGVKIMPFFRKTEISDKELADLGAYLSPR